MSQRLYELEKRISQLESDLKQLQQRLQKPVEPKPGRPKKAE